MMAALYANAHRKKGADTYQPEDFVPRPRRAAAKEEAVAGIANLFRTMT